MDKIRLGIGQVNFTVGDIKGNCKKITDYIKKAQKNKVDILSFPELFITGYPPEDLLLKSTFIKENLNTISSLEKIVGDIVVIVGFVDTQDGNLYNSAGILHNRKKVAVYHKILLPNYGVFDEKRYFSAGNNPFIVDLSGISFGVNICEDIWHIEGPTKLQAAKGAKLIFNISASPYSMGKTEEREDIIRQQCMENNITVCYTNLVGGQDEIVFDGGSFVMDNTGNTFYKAPSFREALFVIDIPIEKAEKTQKAAFYISHSISENKPFITIPEYKEITKEEEVYLALMIGLRDYVLKNGFKKVVLGLSGGIDSSLVATIASDALGSENVVGVFMPSRYSSKESEEDAKLLAENLKIAFITIPIDDIFTTYLETLSPIFSGKKLDITEENLQARIRGNILMALSNKFGYIVLTTGNKSEISVGYSTLYGDMAGGFAVIKDVYKTLVYKLAQYRNSVNVVIPERILTKEPTAELRPDQKDQDTLPPYETLDGILKEYIEKDKNFTEIVSSGFDRETVRKVIAMVDRSEYKRRQAPPGTKITPKAFGKDRRMPITNRFTL
ncbi:MAG: NAD+ synthase [Candidatus Ratteibacteria bacterium]|nr:NAD+ synthase [Candidatus Ratteibacteria bacterium]